MKKTTNRPVLIIFAFLIGFLLLNQFQSLLLSTLAIEENVSTDSYLAIRMGFKILYALVSFWLIKKYKLLNLAGLGNQKFKNWFLLIFPLYLLIITSPEPGEIDFAAIPLYKFGILLFHVISIGFAEEYMMRGFMQSFLLKHFGATKRGIYFSVIGTGILFGVLHLVKFDKGLYGEISQILYATFIGTMFGAILLRTNKIWPLVVLHALIDFINNFDKLQREEVNLTVNYSTTSLQDAIVISLVVLPYFIYGLLLLRKVKVEDIQEKII